MYLDLLQFGIIAQVAISISVLCSTSSIFTPHAESSKDAKAMASKQVKPNHDGELVDG